MNPTEPAPSPWPKRGAGIAGAVIVVAGLFAFTHPGALQAVLSYRPTFLHREPAGPPPFDPSLLTWSAATTTAPWEARDSQEAFVFNNKRWMMGGLDGNGHVDANMVEHYWEATHFNDIWSTSDGANWTLEKAHAEWSPRRSMSVVEFHGKLWMIGGFSPTDGLVTDIWQSDDAITWTKVLDRAAFLPREGQTIEVFNDKLWMIGGVNYDKRKALNDVWYSDDGIDWKMATSSAPWSPRWDHATTVFNGKMYLAGGMDLTLQAFNDVWSTDDGINWTLVTANAPWASRQGGTLFNFHNLLWVTGRLNDKDDGYGPSDVWYSADGLTWNKTQTDPAWIGREDYAGLILNDRMYIIAGMGADWVWQNDVWVSSE